IDDGGALPGNSKIGTPGAPQVSEGNSDRCADLIAVIVAGNLVQVVQLPGQAAVFESPFRAREVGDLPRALGQRLLDRWDIHPGRWSRGESRARSADKDILQVAAVEKNAIVAWACDQAEGVQVAFEQGDPWIQVLDEEALAVIAELRNDDERNVLAVHQGI